MAGKVVAVVPAAGTGSRMGGGPAKQYRLLGGLPLLTRTLMAVEAAPEVQAVVVVAPPGQEDELRARCLEPYPLAKVAAVVPGGAQRTDSVTAGVAEARELGAEWVLVHDGARPLAGPGLFAQVLEAARRTGAATAAAPCVDTVKEAGEGGLVARTLDRDKLWLVHTPQGFSLELLEEALAQGRAQGGPATDEASLVERLGKPVELVVSGKHNLKVTTPEDLVMASGWLAAGAMPRWGQGLDVHRLVPERALVLAGVQVPHELGLLGHSDADVATHALMDALLAAAGLGDIGGMFPDSDPAYAGADSLELMTRVVERLAGEGLRPFQATVTIAAQKPKLAPFIPEMRANLARVLGLEPGMVNVAATTTEGLGLVGREEGMAALALAAVVPVASPDLEPR